MEAVPDLARLEAERQTVRAVFDQTFELIAVLDTVGNVLDANQAAIDFAAITLDQVLGKPFWGAPWWAHAAVEQARLREAISQAAGGEFVRFETTHRHPDGDLHAIDFSLKPVRDGDGQVLWLIAEARDITERTRAEEQVALGNSLREILLRSIGDDVFADVLDFVRARFASRFGFVGYIRDSDGALVCPSLTRDIWEQCDVPAKATEFPRASWGSGLWARVLLERRALFKNTPHQTPPGHVPLHRSMGAPLLVDGVLLGSIHLANRDQDYTQADLDSLVQICAVLAPTLSLWLRRRQAEERAQQAQRHREELIATIDGIVWEAEAATFEFSFVSAQAERLLGYPAAQWIGSPTFWADHIHPEDRDGALDYCATAARELRDHSFDYRMLAADGRVVWLRDVVSVVAERGRPVKLRGVMLDITSRKQAEAERTLLELQLRQSQKMEAIGTLAGGIAHDFNNILAAILGNVTLAQHDVGPGHAAHESLDEIVKASERARGLIRQILAFSRPERRETLRISLPEFVEEDARLLRAALPARVELVTYLAACPDILADRTEIHQVLLNLCTNAWQSMEGRPGRITLIVEGVELDAAQARALGGVSPGPYARLTITDTGRGIDAATLERIFEPFFTTKSVGVGTGLGLFVVHGIVERHGGAIQVVSQPGQGAAFQVYLPAAGATAASPPTPTVAATSLAPGRGARILYVDDEAPLVRIAERVLQQRGYRVTGSTRVAEALAAFAADPTGVDLIITDYNMPNLSGLDVARLARDLRPELPVLLVSGYFTEELRVEAEAAGVRQVLLKPCPIDDLVAAIVRWLAPAR